jgi:hypothetical protein
MAQVSPFPPEGKWDSRIAILAAESRGCPLSPPGSGTSGGSPVRPALGAESRLAPPPRPETGAGRSGTVVLWLKRGPQSRRGGRLLRGHRPLELHAEAAAAPDPRVTRAGDIATRV